MPSDIKTHEMKGILKKQFINNHYLCLVWVQVILRYRKKLKDKQIDINIHVDNYIQAHRHI